MYLNRTKDPVLAAKAVSEQKKLVDLIAGMTVEDEESSEYMKQITDLLDAEVDASVPDYNLSLYYAGKNFYSPIHYAVKKGLSKVTELLLSYNASPDVMDRYSVSPAHLAADTGSEKCLKKLLEYGANVNAKTQEFRKPSRTECTQVPVVRENWLEPEEFSFYILPYEVGTTPLHLAAKKNHVECVKLLIDHGADYNATDERGQTSLYLAAREGLPECVMAQLQNAVGFPILSIPTKDNDTALHECLRHGEKMRECVKELVHRNADVSLHNKSDESAIHLAMKHKWDMDIIKLLILEGYGMDFDRQRESIGWRGSYSRWKGTPLAEAAYGDRRQVHGVNAGRDENLAVFFLRMGASRRNLKEILWYELNRDEPAGFFLETLLESFAYLPSLSELAGRCAQDETSREDSDDESQSLFIAVGSDETDQHTNARQYMHLHMFRANRNAVNLLGMLDPTFAPEAAYHGPPVNARRMRNRTRYFQRRHRNLGLRPRSMDEGNEAEDDVRHRVGNDARAPTQRIREVVMPNVAEKRKQYVLRCSQVPSLAHLSRMIIRQVLKADVRKVISFPIPTAVKEYILLGYPLSKNEDEKDEFFTASENEFESDASVQNDNCSDCGRSEPMITD